MKNIPPKAICSASPLLLMLGLLGAPVLGAPVSQDEAVRVADLWYAMELNSDNTRLDRAERMRLMPSREVLYLVAADSLFDTPLVDRPTLAYVVKYRPHGYVVVAGDDRLSPIMVFSTESDFSWENPERNFLRHFINTTVPARWQQPGATTDRRWLRLRSKAGANLEKVTFDTDSVHLVWNTALWGQWQYYNDMVVAFNGFDPRVPTGCTATAMAIKMRFHSWPVPSGIGSCEYADFCDGTPYLHSFDFGTWTPDWQNMPTNSLTAPNADVAALMYGSGVAVQMDYEPGASGAWPTAYSMSMYFRYKGTTEEWMAHEFHAMKSILGRLPVVASSHPHTVLLDGYREPAPGDSFFHVNCGWEGTDNGWYDLIGIPDEAPIAKSYPYCQPGNWFYIDADWTGEENGHIQTPFNTLAEAQYTIPLNGWMLIKEGLYTGSNNVPVTLSGAKTIVSYNVGTANIDGKLALFEDGRIDITGNGQVRIY